MERETGVEPATSSLGSWHSTTELLPLPYFSSTYQFSKDLGRTTASLFRLLRPSKTMGFDRKMDSKVDSKPVWGTRFRRSRLLSTLLSIPRQIHHITLDV